VEIIKGEIFPSTRRVRTLSSAVEMMESGWAGGLCDGERNEEGWAGVEEEKRRGSGSGKEFAQEA
jgi:hypothetical protein